jgi:class 3 adenylate cyclase
MTLPPTETEVAMQGVAILFCDIRNFTTTAERLSVAEVSRVLAEYFERACECVTRQGGHHLKVMGDGLMAVFDDTSAGPAAPARQAVAAALDLVRVAADFQSWLDTWLDGRGLPEFAIGVGLNVGEVMFGRLGTGDAAEVTPLGDAVNVAARLEALSKELGWAIVASEALLQLAAGSVRVGRRAQVQLRGRQAPVPVGEVLGLAVDPHAPGGRTAHAPESGSTLRALVGTPVTTELAISLARSAAHALGRLHAGGRVHGNLKPEALRLRGGEVTLDDARAPVAIGSSLAFATPYYGAPEAILGGRATPQADFYSLGVILFELLAQRLPFAADSLELLLAQHRHAAPPKLPARHAALQPLLDRLLAKAPAARFADAGELVAFIDAMPPPARRG